MNKKVKTRYLRHPQRREHKLAPFLPFIGSWCAKPSLCSLHSVANYIGLPVVQSRDCSTVAAYSGALGPKKTSLAPELMFVPHGGHYHVSTEPQCSLTSQEAVTECPSLHDKSLRGETMRALSLGAN